MWLDHVDSVFCYNLKNTGSCLETIVLRDVSFSPGYFVKFFNLYNLKQVTRVDIMNCNITDLELNWLFKQMNVKLLEKLTIRRVPISSRLIKYLFEQNPKITELHLQNTNVCNFALLVILEYYKNNPQVKLYQLGINGTEIDCFVMKAYIQSLEYLDISTLHFTPRTYLPEIGIDYLFPAIEKGVGQVTCLNLNDCMLDDASIRSLSNALKTSNLIFLHLQNNNLQDNHVEYLAEGITGNCPLIYLDLSSNQALTVCSVISLMASASRHNQLKCCSIFHTSISERNAFKLGKNLLFYHSRAVKTMCQILGPHANYSTVKSLPFELLQILCGMLRE